MFRKRKVLIVFVRNTNSNPAGYYRIMQYIAILKKYINVEIHGFAPEFYYRIFGYFSQFHCGILLLRITTYFLGVVKYFFILLKLLFDRRKKLYFIQRELVPRRLPIVFKIMLELLLKKSDIIIWDFDDSIIQSGEISRKEFHLLCKYSSSILVCNEFLKSTLPESTHKKVKLVPTTDRAAEVLDLEAINKERLAVFESKIILIWVGTSVNLKYLQKILPELDKAAIEINKAGKQVHLRVVSNSSLHYEGVALNIKNVKWTRSIVNEELKNAHIGLMPLEENCYTKGKCGFKAVQYIGFGLPAIVSNVGYNSHVIKHKYNGILVDTQEMWAVNIKFLSSDCLTWLKYSRNARKSWLNNFSSKKNIEKLNSLLVFKENGSEK